MTLGNRSTIREALVKQMCSISLEENKTLRDLCEKNAVTEEDILYEFNTLKALIEPPRNSATGRNLPEEISFEDLTEMHGLTVGKLKELLNEYNLPIDGKVLIERVEDHYYENNHWGVIYKKGENWFYCKDKKYLTEEEKKTFMDQYHPAWYACKFKDDDKNLYICLHY